jgi:hypothetical protein
MRRGILACFLPFRLDDMSMVSAMFIPTKNSKHSLKESALLNFLVGKA